jgi:hypothetical protein
MSIPFFLPIPSFHAKLPLADAIPLDELCVRAGVRCKASGAWTRRMVSFVPSSSLFVRAMPGANGIEIGTDQTDPVWRARIALSILAYSMMDLVARESIRGAEWARIKAPVGRPASGRRPMSSTERQRRWRSKHKKQD